MQKGLYRVIKAIIRVIDSISVGVALVVRWFCLALVLVLCYEVIARYVFQAPSVWAYETSIMLGMVIYALGWAYVLRIGGHVRVDIIYARLRPKGKAIVDLVCTLVFFFPLIITLTFIAAKWTLRAWVLNEKLGETFWYPTAIPIRAVILLGLCLFSLQGIVEIIRNLYLLTGSKTYD